VTPADSPIARPASRVYVLDDHVIFRDILLHYLKETEVFEVVGADRRWPDAYAAIRRLQPEVVVVDPGPRPEDIAPTVALLRQAAPRAALIALSFSYDEDYAAAARQAGVEAYIDKLAAAEDLIGALRQVTGRS
jgi:DNA-binding NarL/FixJ family response regulator